MSDLHEKTAEFYRYATGAKRKAAQFILMHADEVAFMTLEQVAEKAGVSPATITRTATEIGYSGFPELLAAARSSIRRDMAPVERLDTCPVHEGSSGFTESVEHDRRSLDAMLRLNPAEVVSSAVDLLAGAKQLRLFTSRTSYGAMSFFAYVLGQIRPGVTLLTEAEGRLADQLLDVSPDDVFFLADLPRYSRVVTACAREAKEGGARLICVTDGPDSPIAGYADVALFVPYASRSFFNSNVATLALYNALGTSLNLRLKDASLPRLERHNALLRRFATLVMQKQDQD